MSDTGIPDGSELILASASEGARRILRLLAEQPDPRLLLATMTDRELYNLAAHLIQLREVTVALLEGMAEALADRGRPPPVSP